MKILYFYPDNPMLSNQGNNARALVLLQYFKNKAFNVDLVGCESNEYSSKEMELILDRGLVKNIYLLNKHKSKFYHFGYFFKESLPNFFLNKIKQFNRAKLNHKVGFNKILKKNSYDYIIISYSCWATLIENNKNLKKAKLVIDTHDFLTSQFQITKKFKLGSFFQKEMALLNLFDTIIPISIEEKYIYSQFLKKNIEIVPHSLPDKSELKLKDKKYDIIYVASDNPHNREGIKWFFENVYPILNSDIRICVIGKISKYINDYANVEKNLFVKDLDQFYASSKIAICPMFTGTGLKIKVIEAMSLGLPIICNERGIDGLFNKTNNGCLVTNNPNNFANNINRLLNDNSFYEDISNQSLKYFLDNHHTDKVYRKLDKIFIKIEDEIN